MTDSTALPTAAALAAVTLSMQHPLTRTWGHDEARLARLTEAHEFDLQLATDMDLNAQRAAFLNLPGRAESEYLNRWVQVTPDLWALLSIRFEALDRTRPFVDLSGTSRPWTADDLPALGRAALATYGAFQPRYLRVWHPAAPADFADLGLAALGPDRRVLAAPLHHLTRGDRDQAVSAQLHLRQTTDLSRYSEAQAAYDAVDAQHPQHRGQAQLQEHDLQENVEAGELFDVLLKGRWVGYVGAAPGEELGLQGFSVQELILTPQARGRGLGSALSGLLARALLERGAAGGEVLTGQVDLENRGAREAALRAGRADVGGHLRLPL